MSPRLLLRMQLPPNAPFRDRAQQTLLRFLLHHNRLDGIMAFMSVNWALWTLTFPAFWKDWPVTALLGQWTGGHHWLVSWTLLFSGAGSYVSRAMQKRKGYDLQRWHLLRCVAALAGFSSWCMLACLFLTVKPIFSPGVAVYTAFAIAKLLSFIHYFLHIDAEDHNVDSG